MKKFKNTKIVFVTILFVLFFFISKFILDKDSQDDKNYYLNMQTKLLQTKYATSYRYFKIMASDIYNMYSQNQKLIFLLSQTKNASKDKLTYLRTSIYTLLLKNYKRLNNMGISQVHFYLPNNISFLRMYKPSEFGDDVSSIKKSVVLTNKQQKFHEGFEACHYMLGLRFIYPLYDYDKHYIGSVEISYSTKQLLKSITDDFVYDSHILVSKSIAKNTIIERQLKSNYKNTWEAKDYYIEESTHKKVGVINFFNELDTPEFRVKIAKGIQSQQAFTTIAQYNYKHITLSFLPMCSVNGNKNISYIVTYTESEYLSNIELESYYIYILIVVVLALLYLFSIYVIINQENLKELALYDNLTKLPNRTLFKIELKNAINRALRYNSKVALIFIDLDGFKKVNDTYGHHVGDKLLINIAQRLVKVLRKTDLVSRIGGDEFTVILSDTNEIDKILEVAHDIIKSVNEEVLINNSLIHVGASIGVSIYPDHNKNIEELVKLADQMMYISKESGKNMVIIFNYKE